MSKEECLHRLKAVMVDIYKGKKSHSYNSIKGVKYCLNCKTFFRINVEINKMFVITEGNENIE